MPKTQGGNVSILLTIKNSAVQCRRRSSALIGTKLTIRRSAVVSTVLVAVLVQIDSIAFAQFGTVVNLPTDASPPSIFLGTQLNVLDGGYLFSHVTAPFRAYGGEVNVLGGEVGEHYRGHGNSVLNVNGGKVGSFFTAYDNSTLNMRGGIMEYDLRIFDSATGVWSGGVVGGSVTTTQDASLTLVGGEFRLDGAAIPNLTAIGSSQIADLPHQSVISGILSDGTPFIFSRQEGDAIEDGTLTLHTSALPNTGPNEIVVAEDCALQRIRDGQALKVIEGGRIGSRFAASWGSSLHITGGYVGAGIEAIGAEIEISGGEVEGYVRVFNGTVVNITGGAVGPFCNAYRGSDVNISGGAVGTHFSAMDGSNVRISGGEVGAGFRADYGGNVEISGGSVGEQFSVGIGSEATILGGRFGDGIRVSDGGSITLVGSEFSLNGNPVNDAPTALISWTIGSTLSGILADGTPILISQLDGDDIDTDSISLNFAAPPPLDELTFELPNGRAPVGLRSGQSLMLRSGGEINDNFTALAGTRLQVSGGTVGENFEVAGAIVDMSEGRIGQKFDACIRTVVSISGGEVGDHASASGECEVRLSGGSIGNGFVLSANSRATISAGSVGDKFAIRSGSVLDMFDGSINDYFDVGDRPQDGRIPLGGDLPATANIHGGQVGSSISVFANGTLNIFGGNIGGSIRASPSGEVRLYGQRFFLGDQEVEGLAFGMPLEIVSRNISVRALLQDGNEITLNLSTKVGSIDYFSPNAKIWLILTHTVPEPSSGAIVSIVFVALGIGRGMVAGKCHHARQVLAHCH